MEPDRWEHIQTIFHEARTLRGEARTRLLNETCDSTGLRCEVEALLAADDKATGFLEDDVPREDWRDLTEDLLRDTVPERIGRYRIVREVGRGGMGAVYLARRDDGVLERDVALKLIRRGLETDDILRRFLAERQILAQLEHPHIARLYDAGVAEDGRPYFVMEYIDGLPITDYAEVQNLSIDARLRLFAQVCEAVQFAHARLILHRDLKPGNILVDSGGAPRLLDFGLAKVLSEDEESMLTITARPLQRLTPQYASPEQVRGESLTVASDVYSLGVVLYKLLTGKRPYHITTTNPAEFERIVTQEIPKRPSQAAFERQVGQACARRAKEARRKLRGDLDALVMKALEKEPAARYGSAQAFGEDIGRYLRRQPILAQPYTLRYHTQVLARRVRPHVKHIAGVTITALLLTIAALLYGPIDKNPVQAELEGEYLHLLNTAGQVVDRIYLEGGRLAFMSRQRVSSGTAFADLDGDGINEVFYGHDGSKNGEGTETTSYIIAKRVGEKDPLWRLPLRFDLVYPRKPGSRVRDYQPTNVYAGDVDGDGEAELFASVIGLNSFPALLLELDPYTGQVLQQYAHAGALYELASADIDSDGIHELLAAGTNNALGKDAVLAVLDPHQIDGHAPYAGDYGVEGYAPAQHKAYIRFPQSILREALLHNASRVERLLPHPENRSLNVLILEGSYPIPATQKHMRLVIYLFLDERYRVRDVNTGDSYDVVAAKLHREGHLEEMPDFDYWKRWKKRVQYWTGDAWETASNEE